MSSEAPIDLSHLSNQEEPQDAPQEEQVVVNVVPGPVQPTNCPATIHTKQGTTFKFDTFSWGWSTLGAIGEDVKGYNVLIPLSNIASVDYDFDSLKAQIEEGEERGQVTANTSD